MLYKDGNTAVVIIVEFTVTVIEVAAVLPDGSATDTDNVWVPLAAPVVFHEKPEVVPLILLCKIPSTLKFSVLIPTLSEALIVILTVAPDEKELPSAGDVILTTGDVISEFFRPPFTGMVFVKTPVFLIPKKSEEMIIGTLATNAGSSLTAPVKCTL
jgi:hypothetical protein